MVETPNEPTEAEKARAKAEFRRTIAMHRHEELMRLTEAFIPAFRDKADFSNPSEPRRPGEQNDFDRVVELAYGMAQAVQKKREAELRRINTEHMIEKESAHG